MCTTEIRAFLYLIKFVSENATEVQIYGETEISFNMKDVNLMIGENTWEETVKSLFFPMDLEFEYGEENWVTIQFVEN